MYLPCLLFSPLQSFRLQGIRFRLFVKSAVSFVPLVSFSSLPKFNDVKSLKFEPPRRREFPFQSVRNRVYLCAHTESGQGQRLSFNHLISWKCLDRSLEPQAWQETNTLRCSRGNFVKSCCTVFCFYVNLPHHTSFDLVQQTKGKALE